MDKDMLEAHMLSQQAEKLQEQIERSDEQVEQVESVIKALKELKECGDEEALIPLTNGIFVKGQLSKDKKLLVNVGNNTVVEKSIDQTITLLEKQRDEIQEFRDHAINHIQQILEKVQNVQRSTE